MAGQINVATLTATLRANTGQFNAAMGGASKTTARASSGIAGLGKTVVKTTAMFTGIATAAAGLRAAGSEIVGFDKNMRNVNSLAQLGEKDFRNLEKQVLKLAGKTAQAPQTLAAGLYDLVSSGFKGKAALTVLEASARAATAGLTTTEVASGAVAGAINAYGLEARDAAKVSDILFRTVDQGVITFEQLAQGIGPVLPVARKLGVGLEQVGAMTATLTKAGIPAAEAFTYQKGAMVALIKPTENLQAVFKKLGVESGGELVKKSGSLQGALEAISKSVGGNATAMAALFPEIRGMTAAFGVTSSKAKDAKVDLNALKDSSGATAKALEQQSKSISYRWTLLTSILKAKVLSAFISLSEWVDKNKATIKEFGAEISRSATALRDVVAPAIKFLKEEFESLSPQVQKVIKVIAAVQLAAGAMYLAFGPVGVVIAAVAAAAIVIQRNWGTIGPIFDKVKNAITGFVNKSKGDIGALVSAVKTFVGVLLTVWTPIIDVWLGVMRRVLPAMKQVIQGGLQVIKGVIDVFFGVLRGDWGRAWDGLKSLLSGAFKVMLGTARAFTAPLREIVVRAANGIAGAFSATVGKALAAAWKVFQAIVAPFHQLGGRLFSIGVNIISSLAKGIASAVGGAVKAAVGAAGSVVKGVTGALGIGSPSKVFIKIGEDIQAGMAIGLARGVGATMAAAKAGLIFPMEQAIETLEAKKAGLQASFESADFARRLSEAQSKVSEISGKKAYKGKGSDLAAAKKDVAELRREMERTKAVGRIDLQISGIERAKNLRDALNGISSTLKDKLSAAVSDFRSNWEKTRGAVIDAANTQKLAAFDVATQQMLAGTEVGKELQALRDANTAEELAAQQRQISESLATAQKEGDAAAIAAALQEQARFDRNQKITALEQQLAAETAAIEAARAAERKALEDQMLADRIAAQDAEAAAFETSLQRQLDAEFLSLQQRKQSYATFVGDVQSILGALGLTFDADAGFEAALAVRPKPTKKKQAKKPKKRALGGMTFGQTLVGEWGPEIADFPVGTRIYNADDTRQMLGEAGGGGGNQYTISVSALDPRTAAQVVVRAIDEFERRNGPRYARA